MSLDEESRTQANLFRLAINTIVYMQAFPECVKNCSPSNDLKECSYIIETSEEFSKQKELWAFESVYDTALQLFFFIKS